MKIYIAAPLHNRADACAYAALLRMLGHTVTSSWHDHETSTVRAEKTLSVSERHAIAQTCMLEIERCDLLLWLCDDMRGRTGSAFEAGYATALKKTVATFARRSLPCVFAGVEAP